MTDDNDPTGMRHLLAGLKESGPMPADLNERIERLSAIQARLIRMSYFEAKSHQQISDELGMPLGTVKSYIRRAFQQLQSSVQGAA